MMVLAAIVAMVRCSSRIESVSRCDCVSVYKRLFFCKQACCKNKKKTKRTKNNKNEKEKEKKNERENEKRISVRGQNDNTIKKKKNELPPTNTLKPIHMFRILLHATKRAHRHKHINTFDKEKKQQANSI